MPQDNPGQFAESAQCVCYIHVWCAFVFREDCDQPPLVRSYICRLIMAAYKQLAFNHRHWALWPSRKCYNVSFCIGYKLAKPRVYMCMHFSNQDQNCFGTHYCNVYMYQWPPITSCSLNNVSCNSCCYTCTCVWYWVPNPFGNLWDTFVVWSSIVNGIYLQQY